MASAFALTVPGTRRLGIVGSPPVQRSRPAPARTFFAVIGSTLVVAAALGACKSDGRTLRPANGTQTQSVYTPTTTTVPATVETSVDIGKIPPFATSTTALSTVPFTLQLPFGDEGVIDTRFTCYGADVHPQIAWFGAPVNTVEIALVVTDPDASDFVHWVIAGLDPTNPLVGDGQVPIGAIEGENGFSTTAAPSVGWKGPCPPAGTTHHYWFTLYALSQQVDLPTGSSSADLLAVIENSSIDASEVTGIYTAPGANS
jgi:Raf kinase inhibitor-like YbhB/YbcL family protein